MIASVRECLILLLTIIDMKSSVVIREIESDHDLIGKLIELSAIWESEGSCYGYRCNSAADFEQRRIFIAELDGAVIAYLLGMNDTAQNISSIAPDGAVYFELEEIYVKPEFRSQGIGKELFLSVERTLGNEQIDLMLLSTATKNHKAVFHFYLDELGMSFWSARLFKRLSVSNRAEG